MSLYVFCTLLTCKSNVLPCKYDDSLCRIATSISTTPKRELYIIIPQIILQQQTLNFNLDAYQSRTNQPPNNHSPTLFLFRRQLQLSHLDSQSAHSRFLRLKLFASTSVLSTNSRRSSNGGIQRLHSAAVHGTLPVALIR